MHTIYPAGHFYSPLLNNDEVKKDEQRIWPEKPEIIGVDFNDASQREFLTTVVPHYISQMTYPVEAHERRSEFDFYLNNSQFPYIDAIVLFILLNHLKPKRIIEIGSGFSTLVTADVNNRVFNNAMEVVCVEPYPNALLKKGIPGVTVLLEQRVQDIPQLIFDRLEPGDILFVDTSHVAKTGSDVLHIYFELLPRLAAGVHIHIHDIFLPFEYPKNWVIDEGRGWNEQYLLRALLMHSDAYAVMFGSQYAAHAYRELLTSAFGTFYGGGSSFWMTKR